MNHGHALVSNVMSAKQFSSSASCCGPPVPTLVLSHAVGSSGSSGVLVTLAGRAVLPDVVVPAVAGVAGVLVPPEVGAAFVTSPVPLG